MNRLRLAQDEIAKLLPEIEALRNVDMTDDKDGAAQEALDRHMKRAEELSAIVEKETAIEAKLAAARSKLVGDSEPRAAVEKASKRSEPSVSSLRDFETRDAAEVAGRYLAGLAGRQTRASTGLGETVGTIASGAYNTAGAEYVPIELYGAVINRIKYSSVGMQIGRAHV